MCPFQLSNKFTNLDAICYESHVTAGRPNISIYYNQFRNKENDENVRREKHR